MAVEDQQRVVDAHPQPQQDSKHRGDVGNRHEVRAQADQPGGYSKGRSGGGDRQHHGHHGTERDEQHEGGEGDPDQLPNPDLRGGQRRHALPSDGDLQRLRPGVLHEVGQRLQVVARDLDPGSGVLDGGVGHRAVRADLTRSHESVRATHAGDRVDRGDLGEQLLDLDTHVRVVHRSLRRPHDERVGVAGRLGKALVQQVHRSLAVRLRQREAVPVVRAHHPRGDLHPTDCEQPQQHDHCRVAIAPHAERSHHSP